MNVFIVNLISGVISSFICFLHRSIESTSGVSALSFVLVDTYIALFACAIANGIVYVAGLSYVNIRSERQERPMRVALCHAWKMIGFGIVLTIYLYLLDEQGMALDGTLSSFYKTIGYIIIGTSGIFVFLLLLNEYRQRQGLLYNYRDCLDHDNAIANNYCKLFSKNEVLIERNPTVSAAGLWKSTENLLPRNKKNFTNYWTLMLMLPKLHGAILFHYFTVMMALSASKTYIEWHYAQGIVVWLMALGAVLGCFWLRLMQNAKVFTLSSIIAIIAIGVSFVFYQSSNSVIAVCFWIYFLAASIATSVPDGALMEVSKIRFSEGALALGFFLEIIPIAVLQSLQRDRQPQEEWYTENYFLAVAISSIVVLVVVSMIYQLHMPNTYNKSLLQIQNELLKYKKYFAFDFDKEVSPTAVRRSSNGNHYSTNNNVNVFENQARTFSQSRLRTPSDDYTDIHSRLPDPPTNKVTNFDYNTDIPKPTAIIPRVNFGKTAKSTAGSETSKGYSVYN